MIVRIGNPGQILYSNLAQQYHIYQNQLKNQLDKKEFKEAEQTFQFLLTHFLPVVDQHKPFDARLQTILENSNDPDRFVKAARLAIMMENGKVKTSFSQSCLLASYIQIGNTTEAEKLKQELLGDYKRERSLVLDLETHIGIFASHDNKEMQKLMTDTLEFVRKS
jgi:hypothetical protein